MSRRTYWRTNVPGCRTVRDVVRRLTAATLCGLTSALLPDVIARETPPSYGGPARVDTPVLRIPFASTAPTIDGTMEPGEWEDASALSGFWYDYAQADFRFLAPVQTQLQVYLAYDRENLYLAYSSPVYPVNSWLKARGRFPDVLHHPLYGTQWDDHVEIEFRPYHDIAKGFQLGLLRWDVNPINTYCDWYWTQQKGEGFQWKSNARIRSVADGHRWTIEMSVPHDEMVVGLYKGTDDTGAPLVTVPPPDGTIYRAWFVRGIGGNGAFFNAFDNHCWNTTKTQIIFDSKAPSFQINDLGPIMEDIISLQLTVKNHSSRSETVQLGFFVESAEGPIYSSYDAPELDDGLLELTPGEVRKLNLRQPFPGITADGNVLWFDVRSAGRPAKTLFRTRLIRFHSMDGGVTHKEAMFVDKETGKPRHERKPVSFRERRLDVISVLRPPRRDFDFRWNFSWYAKRMSGIVDRGIHGAGDDAKRAVEAKMIVMKNNEFEDIVKETTVPFHGDFACFLFDLPDLVNGESYKVSLLLFDENKRIVGERDEEPFQYTQQEWQQHDIGLDDTVWEPFEPIRVTGTGFETLKHRFAVAPSGLPAQIGIKPDARELPLDKRAKPETTSRAGLLELGRGPQFRAPMRIEAVVDGQRVTADIAEPAKLVRQWKSEVEYSARLRVGPIDVDLVTQYDCDGSMHCRLDYGSEKPATVDKIELVADIAGLVDLALSECGQGGMTGADTWECTLPGGEGVVWDSAGTRMELMYSKFVPWFWFGSGDRAFSWYCDSNQGWLIDREGSTMQLERDAAGAITWRVQFVNHTMAVEGKRHIDFSILTHPAKPKPRNYRAFSWHYWAGPSWCAGYAQEPIDLADSYLIARWHRAASAPGEMPYEQATSWRKDEPPHYRYGQWRNVGVCRELDQVWEDKATYYFERHVRVGRRVGWWMDEYFPVAFGRSENLATGNAYLRDPQSVGDKELPWQSGFLTRYMRGHYKRLARVFATNNVPQRQHTWSNNASTMVEPFIFNSLLVEECGAAHRSYEVDAVTQFPNSLYRYMCHNFTGLATTLCADATPVEAGDDKRLDRQQLGRALLNDIGFSPSGPHGVIHHKEQGVRLLGKLAEFGFFEDVGIEKIPYWRARDYVRCGNRTPEESKVYVTVYRRPMPDGSGSKAIFVIMNESDKPVELPLSILDPTHIFGGTNSLKSSAITAEVDMPADLADWWKSVSKSRPAAPALMNFETGEFIARASPATETYGPVHVPYHDFRVLYGHSAAE